MVDKFTRTGIIRASRSDGAYLRLTIRTTDEDFKIPMASVCDPGILAVENFLTEEQEREILEAL
jgi:hypothetical protein